VGAVLELWFDGSKILLLPQKAEYPELERNFYCKQSIQVWVINPAGSTQDHHCPERSPEPRCILEGLAFDLKLEHWW